LIALEKDLDPNDVKMLTSKKHFKHGTKGQWETGGRIILRIEEFVIA